jgi:aspartate/methionine/tyrosine aminotransferase
LTLAGPERRAGFERLALSYTPTWGTPELLDAVARTYDRLGPEHVLTFAGAEEAMFWALQELVGPGDHAVVTVPNYQSMESVTIATGADVDGLVLSPGDGWALDLDALTKLLRPTTRLVCVNFPNNPTGALPSRETFARLAQLCDGHGIRLFSDEVYRGLELDRDTMLPQAAELSDRAISLNVMSKSYGLPGLRIGWLATQDRALLERLERRKHYTAIANSAPSEFLATIALAAGDRIQARNRAIIAANVPLLDAFFERHADRFEWSPPQGGCVCFPRLLGGEDAGPFCRQLVQRAGVILLPAEVYASALGEVPREHFRIGVGRHGTVAALTAFEEFLAAPS